MGVFWLMTHLGLSKVHFVCSFNTVAQSIAFISLPSTKYVITGYIMTITCRKSLRSYFDSRGTFSGSGEGGDWGAHAAVIKVVALTKCRRQQSEALMRAASKGGGSERSPQGMRGICCESLTTIKIFLSKNSLSVF